MRAMTLVELERAGQLLQKRESLNAEIGQLNSMAGKALEEEGDCCLIMKISGGKDKAEGLKVKGLTGEEYETGATMGVFLGLRAAIGNQWQMNAYHEHPKTRETCMIIDILLNSKMAERDLCEAELRGLNIAL